MYALKTRIFNYFFFIINNNLFINYVNNLNFAKILLKFKIINKYIILIFFEFLLYMTLYLTIILISLL